MTKVQKSFLHAARIEFHRKLMAGPLEEVSGVPSFADGDNARSIKYAKFVAERIGGIRKVAKKRTGQAAGREFEQIVADFIGSVFPRLSHLRPGAWSVIKSPGGISQFEQYQHLEYLLKAVENDPLMRASLGGDYLIEPDVVIARAPEPDEKLNAGSDGIVDDTTANYAPLRRKNNQRLLLHASISCKWTLRSDRGQNARTEALNLTRNRKGWVPHAVLVTAEPLPSRIQSVTGGMGDLDCVYHVALPELLAACRADGDTDTIDDMIRGRRLRDITDLPLDLAV